MRYYGNSIYLVELEFVPFIKWNCKSKGLLNSWMWNLSLLWFREGFQLNCCHFLPPNHLHLTWEINCSRTIYRSPSVYQSLWTYMLKISFKGVNETVYSQCINVSRCCTTYSDWVHWSKHALHLRLCRRTRKIIICTLIPWKIINWFSLLAESVSTKVIKDIFETTSASGRATFISSPEENYMKLCKYIWITLD